MTDQPIPRAERRRLARDAMRDAQGDIRPGRERPIYHAPQSFWWSFLLIFLFFFVCTVYAIVQGLELWRGKPYLPVVIGWVGGIVGLGALFWLIKFHRKQTRWGRGVFFICMPAVLLGVGAGLLWTRSLAVWQDNVQFQQELDTHSALIKQTEAWSPGDRWNTAECKRGESDALILVEDTFRGKIPPTMRAIPLVIGVEEVLYQAGCTVDWDKVRDASSRLPAGWSLGRPIRTRAVKQAWAWAWPNAEKGCLMQAERAKSQGRAADVGVLKEVCQAMATSNQGRNPWDPNRFGGADGMQVPVASKTHHPDLAPPTATPTNAEQLKPLRSLEAQKPNESKPEHTGR